MVKSRDLEIGRAYCGGSAHSGTRYEGFRNTFVYLGRTKSKGYLWLFVGGQTFIYGIQ